MSPLPEIDERKSTREPGYRARRDVLPANACAGRRSERRACAPRRRALVASLALVFSVAAADGPATRGNGWVTVSNCNDGGPGSLREAMAVAIDNDFVDARALACGTITLTTGQIYVAADDVTLAGPGAGALTVTNGGGSKYDGRIFSHSGTGILAVVGMTLSDGAAAGSAQSPDALGGCIYSNGTVVLSNGIVKNCSARASTDVYGNAGMAGGGGIFAHAVILTSSTVSGCLASSVLAFGTGGGGVMATDELRMFSSELRDNVETGTKYGGGGAFVGGLLANAGSPHTSIVYSTIAGNSAANGGGLSLGGDVSIRNSTISGNSAVGYGGGIVTGQGCDVIQIAVLNSTIAGNHSDDALDGGAHLGGCVTLHSTIIAGNTPNDLVGDAQISGSNNLVGLATPVTPALPQGTIVADPRLGPLAHNGGSTRTHALRGNSAAIDNGNNVAPALGYDQRGFDYPRAAGAGPDIGAYELQDGIFRDGFD